MSTTAAPPSQAKSRRFSWPVVLGALAFVCVAWFASLPATDGPPPQRAIELLSIQAICALPSMERVEQEIAARGSWTLQETLGPIAVDAPCSKLVSGIAISDSGLIRIRAKIAEMGQSSSKPFESYKRRDVVIELTPHREASSKISWKHKGLPVDAFPKSYNE